MSKNKDERLILMKTVLKNFQIINATNAIKELITNPNIKTKPKWNFIKNLNEFQSIVDDYSKLEFELLRKYALIDSASGNIQVYNEDKGNFKKGDPMFPTTNHTKYLKEREELLQCDNEVEVHMIKLDDLPDDIGDGTPLLLCSFLIDDIK